MSWCLDMHAHFLYGVDDGAQTRRDMEDMLDAAYSDGVRRLYATPHVTPGIRPIPRELHEQRLAEARAYCRAKDYDLELTLGAEILYTPAVFRYARSHELPTMGDSDAILLEFTPAIDLGELRDAVAELTRLGYRVILAHIERYRCLYLGGAFSVKRRLKVAYQVNCGTVLRPPRGLRGWEIRRWFRRGLIDYVATDAHNCSSRPTRMKAACERLSAWLGEARADGLTSAGKEI